MKRIVFSILLISLLIIPIQSFAESAKITGSQTRMEIRRIIDDPRFHYPDYWGWLEKAIDKLISFLNFLRPSKPIKINPDFEELLRKIAFGAALLLPAILIAIFNRFWRRESRNHADIRQFSQIDSTLSHLDIAGQLADSGDYRQAIRHLYLESLSSLKRSHLLPEGQGYSDYEHLRFLKKTIGATHPVYIAFYDLLRLFQSKWYGLKPCLNEDYRTAYHWLESIYRETGGKHA